LYRNFFKRLIDLLLGISGFLLLLPLFLLTAILLLFANKGRIFFFQPRPGLNGQIFHIIKFKTMRDAYGADGELLPDADRLTKIGSFVRKTSLDEIPQLLNVIIGNMSLIGPRPLLIEYLPLYNDEQKQRHLVKPGITGWAQVNGRNAITWEQKFKFDVWYVNNLSFKLDAKIILMTVTKVIKSEGISQNNHVTMGKFTGN
jgi:undecaprenyl phosphate N,N'-diacetylbacillosamine 1-phosphate transferase